MSLKIKPFNLTDKTFVLRLRNQKDVSNNSLNKKIITKKIHNKWFSNILKKNKHNFIIYSDKKKIGFLRFEKVLNKFYVNIALIKEAQNKNFSKKALLLGENKISYENLYAKVLKNNIKSLSLFRSCNYNIVSNNKKYFLMKKKNTYKDSEKLINQIELLRKKNNTNWMDILKIAFKFDPKNASKAMNSINKYDKKISELSHKLSKHKND